MVLGALLRLGVSLRQRDLVGARLAECHEAGGGTENMVEELFARMASQTLEIVVNPEAVGLPASTDGSSPLEIADNDHTSNQRRFGAGVTRHLRELRVSRDILLRRDATVPTDQIRLRVNDRLGPPIRSRTPTSWWRKSRRWASRATTSSAARWSTPRPAIASWRSRAPPRTHS